MKTRLMAIALCFSLLMLLLVGCNDDGGGDTPEGCTHSYSNGVCIHCGESDPDFNSGSGGGSGSGSGSNEGSGSGSGSGSVEGDGDAPADGEDGTPTPPIDFGGETELPFVPAT